MARTASKKKREKAPYKKVTWSLGPKYFSATSPELQGSTFLGQTVEEVQKSIERRAKFSFEDYYEVVEVERI